MQDASRLPQPSIVDIDPEDPSQLLDDAGQFSVVDVDLEVEAQPEAEAESDMDLAAIESSADDQEEEDLDEAARDLDMQSDPSDRTSDYYTADADDTGDLYGVHQPAAQDRDAELNFDREVFLDADLGENWLETLGKKAAESGVVVEHEVDVIDDSDEHAGHHSTESGDRPVADKGSGGDGGL
jgi:hypothetical protein